MTIRGVSLWVFGSFLLSSSAHAGALITPWGTGSAARTTASISLQQSGTPSSSIRTATFGTTFLQHDRHHASTRLVERRPTHHQASRRLFMIPRGGAATAAAIFQNMQFLSVRQTAIAYCLFLAFSGLSIVAVPNVVTKNLYQIRDYQNPASNYNNNMFSSYLLRALGCLSLGTSIFVAATLLFDVPATQAMGWSLLPRVVFWLGSIVFGVHEKVGVQNTRILLITVFATVWSCLSLSFGLGNPVVSAGIFATVALGKSVLFVVDPAMGARKFFGMNVATNEMKQARALSRALGNELATSALLLWLSTIAGVEPAKAAGYTCLLWIALLADMAFVDKTWRLMDSNGPMAQIIHIGFSALFAIGFLR